MSRETDAGAKRRQRLMWAAWSSFAVVVIVAFIILAKVAGGGSDSSGTSKASPAPESLVSKVTSVPDSVFAAVGQGNANPLPKPIQAPALTQDNKPHVVYIGAEYCPYCATERWPMIIALSRFGTWKNLNVTESSTSDVYPGTKTFSFHGATYTSQYLSFTGVETQTNQPDGSGSYTKLDTLSDELNKLLNTYDAAPYVAGGSAGSIPFVDFGGKFIISGSTYQPQVLQGKSYDQIADSLKDTGSDIAKGAIGSANAITAALCQLTGNKPDNVCTVPVIQDLENKINAAQ